MIFRKSRGWLNQPIWKIVKMGSSSPRFGVKITNIWNQHLVIYYTPNCTHFKDQKNTERKNFDAYSIHRHNNNHHDNPGSGKWPLWRLNSSSRDPFSTSMGGRVFITISLVPSASLSKSCPLFLVLQLGRSSRSSGEKNSGRIQWKRFFLIAQNRVKWQGICTFHKEEKWCVYLDPPFGCQISAPRSVFSG